METSQNGWPTLAPDETVSWVLPIKGPKRSFRLRKGHAGFVLACFATWFHRHIERLNTGVWDEWAYAYRSVRGSSVVSNHASGTAIDLNATLHPLGKRGTFKRARQYVRIRAKLLRWGRVIRWGGDYSYRKDEMHFEINARYKTADVHYLAKKLLNTKLGREVKAANPHYRMHG